MNSHFNYIFREIHYLLFLGTFVDISFKSVVTNTSTQAHLSTLREMASEIEDDMEQLKIMNTSMCPSSIHNELQFLVRFVLFHS